MREKRHRRTTNFTNDEKAVLMELVAKYKEVIENKQTNASTNAKKAKAWKCLAEDFNTFSKYCQRSSESLRTCWENIKRQAKKQAASQKKEIFKTDGGRSPSPQNGVDNCKNIVKIVLEGLENPYNSDALVDENREKTTTQSSSDCTKMDFRNEEKIWTPSSIQRPVIKALKPTALRPNNKGKKWVKKRRRNQQSLSDILLEEKIILVRTIIRNSKKESRLKTLILQEQLKQERIKTQRLLE